MVSGRTTSSSGSSTGSRGRGSRFVIAVLVRVGRKGMGSEAGQTGQGSLRAPLGATFPSLGRPIGYRNFCHRLAR